MQQISQKTKIRKKHISSVGVSTNKSNKLSQIEEQQKQTQMWTRVAAGPWITSWRSCWNTHRQISRCSKSTQNMRIRKKNHISSVGASTNKSNKLNQIEEQQKQTQMWTRVAAGTRITLWRSFWNTHRQISRCSKSAQDMCIRKQTHFQCKGLDEQKQQTQPDRGTTKTNPDVNEGSSRTMDHIMEKLVCAASHQGQISRGSNSTRSRNCKNKPRCERV